MENTKDILNKHYSNNSKKVINNISNYSKYIPGHIANSLVNEAAAIMDNSDFRPYLYKTLFTIGKEKFMEAVKAAQQANANCRPCYLAKTLKNMREAAA